jgi:hypothetical protein
MGPFHLATLLPARSHRLQQGHDDQSDSGNMQPSPITVTGQARTPHCVATSLNNALTEKRVHGTERDMEMTLTK